MSTHRFLVAAVLVSGASILAPVNAEACTKKNKELHLPASVEAGGALAAYAHSLSALSQEERKAAFQRLSEAERASIRVELQGLPVNDRRALRQSLRLNTPQRVEKRSSRRTATPAG